MVWKAYNASLVGFNNQFGGYEGHYTSQPQFTLLDEGVPFKVYVENNRVTKVAYDGLVYQHQNADGANIHGGNHTTKDWFTFDIGQFAYVDHNGVRQQNLNSEPGFQGGNTITIGMGLDCDVPCFTKGTAILGADKQKRIYVENLKVGDTVWTTKGNRKVIWVGNHFIDNPNTKQNPYLIYNTLILSPNHRVYLPKFQGLMAVKHTTEAWQLNWPSVHYYHFMLEEHSLVYANNILCESLWPGKETMKMLGSELAALEGFDWDKYTQNKAAPFLNKHGKVKS